ncbi:DUF397 domain-containing protein [Streptomyces sp. NPDC047042]|uniref:DUF397 domain-containing protein n=1 Tax=Streptomyces sp. NPDC047042 TaxID=3154807 RepID=UPI003409FDA2
MTTDPTSEATWQKSTYSNDSGGNCVEVAHPAPTPAHIALRDSKHPQGPALLLPRQAFTALLDHLRS